MTARRVAVVGGGIGGLTAAWLLHRRGHQVLYVDPADRPGGFLRSTWRGGYLCESGPSSVRLGGVLRSVVERIGLNVLHASPSARRRLLWSDERLIELPSSILGLLRSPLLGPWQRLRLLAEPFVPARRTGGDETVLELGRRRLGEGATRALLEPAVAGTYGGDVSTMSATWALPSLVEAERRHGSITRGLLASRSPRAPLVSFAQGMEELPRAMAAETATVRVHARATALERTATGWRIGLVAGPPLDVERVLLSAAPHDAASLLAPLAPAAAELLGQLRFAPITVVHLGFSRVLPGDLGMDLDAFGFLVSGPSREASALLACQYESSLLPGRAPPGGSLLRVILRGAQRDLDDEAVAAMALDGVRRCAGLRATPELVHVERHPRALPSYPIGHGRRVAELKQAVSLLRGVRLACHGLEGVGVRSAVEQAAAAARDLVA